MAYKSFDEDDANEHVDEPKRLSENGENQSNAFEDFQTIDAEIIDYGICEDEYKETFLIPKKPLKLATQTLANAFNSSNVCKSKLACIKVVDCDRYPWYYAKYKKQILERKYFNVVEQAKDIVNCLKDNISKKFIPVDENKRSDSSDMMKNNGSKKNSVIVDLCKFTSKSGEKKSIKANKMQDMKVSNKMLDTVKTVNKMNAPVIDLKKNTGLVGMKIQRIVEDDETKANKIIQKTTKIKQNFTKQSDKHPNKSCKKAVNLDASGNSTFTTTYTTNTLNTKKAQKKQSNLQLQISHGIEKSVSLKCSLRLPSQQILKKLNISKPIKYDNCVKNYTKHNNTTREKDSIKSEETIASLSKIEQFSKDLNKATNNEDKKMIQYKPMPKSKRIAMEKQRNKTIDNLTDMENEKLKITTDLVHSTPVDNNLMALPAMYPSTKTCELSSKSFIHVNKLTQKVLKIMDNFSKIDNKPSAKDILKTDTSTTNLHAQLELTEQNKTIKKSKSSTFSERVEHDDMNSNNDKNICSGDNITESKNKMAKNKMENNLNRTKNDDTIVTKQAQYKKTENNHDHNESSSKVDNIANSYKNQEINTVNNAIKTDFNTEQNVSVANQILNESLDNSINYTRPETTDELHLKQPNLSYRAQKATSPEKKKSRRKQLLKILAVKTVGNIDDYIKINQIGKATVQSITLPSHEPSQSQQNESSVQITGRNKETTNGTVPKSNIMKITTHTTNGTVPKSNIMKITKHTPQNTRISTVVIRHPLMSNNTTKNVPNVATVSQPYNINRPEIRRDAPRPLLSLPLLPTPLPTVRHQVPLNQMHPWSNVYQRQNYTPPFFHRGPHGMPFNENFQQRSHYMQNNYTQHPVYNEEMSPTMPCNTNMFSGYHDMHPNNVYWPHNYNYYKQIPPPPLPHPPFPQKSFNQNGGGSIIGSNANGLVKKINIPTSSGHIADNEIDSIEGIIKQNIIKRYDVIADTTAPVSSKSEMIKELDKAAETISPNKTDLKRPRNCKQSVDQTTCLVKNKPGPLSKKIKYDMNTSPARNRQPNLLHKGYSPPILPIPTYENILSEVQTPAFQKQMNAPNPSDNKSLVTNNNPPIKSRKRKASLKRAEGDNSKKISLDEYKKKTTEKPRRQENKGTIKNDSNFTKDNSITKPVSNAKTGIHAGIQNRCMSFGFNSGSTIIL